MLKDGCGWRGGAAARVADQKDGKNNSGATLGPHQVWQQGICMIPLHGFARPKCEQLR